MSQVKEMGSTGVGKRARGAPGGGCMTFDEAKNKLEDSVGREGICAKSLLSSNKFKLSTPWFLSCPLLFLCYASNRPFALRLRLLYLISEQKAIGLRQCQGQLFTLSLPPPPPLSRARAAGALTTPTTKMPRVAFFCSVKLRSAYIPCSAQTRPTA